MANLLTFKQVYFLADKLGYRISDVPDGTRYKYKAPEYAIAEDGSLLDSSNLGEEIVARTIQEFWYIRYEEWIAKYQRRSSGTVQLRFVRPLSKDYLNNLYEYYAVTVRPSDFIPACKKYFGGTPLYVGTKRVNQAICKVGGGTQGGTRYLRQKGWGYQKDHVERGWCDA